MKAQPKFNIGVSVIVKANVKDPDYDIKIEGWQGRKIYHFPLCDLDCVEKESNNYQIVHDFAVWFVNR